MTQPALKPLRSEKEAAKLANPERLPFGKLLAWAGAELSAAGNFTIGIFNNVGMAAVAWFVGIVMTAAGYAGDAATQPAFALTAIRGLFGQLPAALFATIVVLMFAYTRFEHKVLPEAQERVRVLREKQGAPSFAAAVDENADGLVGPDELPVPPLVTKTQGVSSHADPYHAVGPLLPTERSMDKGLGTD
ncbi:hypothetical protein QFZ36_002638 [Pseudarthrobacter siccitolerans]|uniref:Uncharacterized protein n=1 Tax=Pseudarthrobacter siccitolerans TaxID=861266 RepID=A0ABU0PNE7_9MICC|nr:hypothetical protein [Pseudarthrobacter siccitolerans]MDQ0675077.1 hypothetical protein [Pseudarthrobacter siccitolerans]